MVFDPIAVRGLGGVSHVEVRGAANPRLKTKQHRKYTLLSGRLFDLRRHLSDYRPPLTKEWSNEHQAFIAQAPLSRLFQFNLPASTLAC